MRKRSTGSSSASVLDCSSGSKCVLASLTGSRCAGGCDVDVGESGGDDVIGREAVLVEARGPRGACTGSSPRCIVTESAWPRSATTWAGSNCTPQALSSGAEMRGLVRRPWRPSGSADRPPAGSISASGSTNSRMWPPRSAYWSMANSVAGERFFGCTSTSTLVSGSILAGVRLERAHVEELLRLAIDHPRLAHAARCCGSIARLHRQRRQPGHHRLLRRWRAGR